MTRVAGKHTMKAGGSYTHRSREILNADTIVGRFDFNQNLTSNCGGITAGCTALANTGFDFASFLLGYASNASRTLFDSGTYTELRPEFAAYFQDDMRLTDRLTVNAGLRWDLYVPWVEENDKQSNFDVSTGRFVVASEDATINGVKVGRYLQTYGEDRLRAARRLRLRPERRRQDDRPRRLRPVLELHARRHLLVEGAEPAVPAGAGDDDQLRDEHPAVERARGASGSPSRGAARRGDAVGVPNRRPRRARAQLQRQRAASVRHQLHGEAAYSGSRTKNAAAQGRPEPGAANRRRHRSEREPAVRAASRRRCARSARCRAPAILDYNGLLVKFQRRFANQFSFLQAYTLAKAVDLNSDNDGTVTLTNIFDPEYNRGPADYDVRHTFSSNWIYELPWAAQRAWGGWQVSGILYLRSGLPITITQSQTHAVDRHHQQPAEHDLRSGAGQPDDRPLVQHLLLRAGGATPPARSGTPAATRCAVPGQFNIDFSLIKNTRIGTLDSELRLETFNLLNNNAVREPERSAGNAAFGTISAIDAGPCGTCGTSERQIQLAFKVKF